MKIRTVREADWPYIRELCCRTGKAGAPIETDRWRFFGEFWVGPYEKLLPAWTWIAEINGKPVGYLTGCPDTRRFYRRRAVLFYLPLFLRTLAREYPENSDTRSFRRRFQGLEKGPEDRFPRTIRAWMRRDYPAHLHMNVEADARKAGVGRALVECFRGELKSHGVPGLHLFCGDAATAFYGRTGFKELAQIEYSKGIRVHALGCKI